MQGIERRYVPATELRAVEREGGRTIAGYAALFDSLSVELMGFRERIEPGAFAQTIEAGDDVRALFNHDPNYVLGRTKSGTLRLREDERGLAVEIDPPDTQVARDVVESIRRGDVDQMSFAFAVLRDSWELDEYDQLVRTLEQVKLYDVSAVTYPAYPETSVGMREQPGNRFDPIYGQVPEIPADLLRAQQGGADEETARARRAARGRELALAGIDD
jgi:HK97 family phage prohead protease